MRRFALAVAALLLSGCATMTARPLGVGQAMQVSLPKLGSTERVDLESLQGQVLLVDVWASWCVPCVRSLPFYKDLQHALGPRGFRFVSINIDEDERAAKRFLRETSLEDLLVLRDPGAETIGPRYRVTRMPTAFYVDRAGRIRHVREGFSNQDRGEIRSTIEALLDESESR